MIKKFEIKDNDISDGYHTFDELYMHRRILTESLFNLDASNCWKSWLHDDGTMFEDYFIVGITTKYGNATYHYHKDYWENYRIPELPKAPMWDNHSGEMAISRIRRHFLRLSGVFPGDKQSCGDASQKD